MATLLEQIEGLESEKRTVEDDIESKLKQQRANDQSRIAWLIVWAFVVALALIFLMVLTNITGDGADSTSPWQAPAEFLAGIVSSVMLPVVTLVLGYYFGKEKTN